MLCQTWFMKRVQLQVLFRGLLMSVLLLVSGSWNRALAAHELSLSRQVKQKVERILKTHHLPGAQVSLVKDGEVLLAEGYGLSDV